MDILLSPPVAFLIYTAAAGLLYLAGRALAGPGLPSAMKSSLYGSGEEASPVLAAPGYKPFFLVAIFFAILHLGVLLIGTGMPSPEQLPIQIVFLAGLIFSLLALILG